MGRIKYFFKVSLPIWWQDKKEILFLIWGLLVALFILVPIGFVATKLEERRDAKARSR